MDFEIEQLGRLRDYRNGWDGKLVQIKEICRCGSGEDQEIVLRVRGIQPGTGLPLGGIFEIKTHQFDPNLA